MRSEGMSIGLTAVIHPSLPITSHVTLTTSQAMSLSGTWGDELTLRAACDSYGVVIRCVTSEAENWYISYEPLEKRLDRELFLAYISPIHYNALR
jgi:hypothetical protein